MTETIVGALLGIGFLTVVNIAVVAYSYGKLNQKVDDLVRDFRNHLDEHRKHHYTQPAS